MGKTKIEARLTSYWKMEIANVLIIPAALGFFVIANKWQIGWASIATLLPVCLLLLIGGQYWRAKLIQLQTGAPYPPAIDLLAKLQWPSFAITAAAIVIACAAWAVPGVAMSGADRWITTSMALMAAIEYVNYYHRYLQHFDHWPDFQRLLNGRGFRRSQMAADIAKWRTRLN